MKALFLLLASLVLSGIASAQCTLPSFTPVEHGTGMCWTPTTTPGVTAYNIYRATGMCTATTLIWLKIVSVAPAVVSYKDLTAQPGVTYCYGFTGTFPSGESDRTLSTMLELTPPGTIAGKPVLLPPSSPVGVTQ